MKNGILYGVGVGPGDKELITLKAVRVLKEADIIAVPVTKGGAMTAYEIVEDHIKDKEIHKYYMPMTKDFEELERNYEEISDSVEEYLKNGKNVAFITLGDPSVYSTYMRINRIVQKRGYDTELIAGVPSFCAAAARLNIALCDRDEPLIILPASYDIDDGLKLEGTKVLMKANKAVMEVRDKLKEYGLSDRAYLVEKCGMQGEKVYRDINELEAKTSYFSVIIVKDSKEGI